MERFRFREIVERLPLVLYIDELDERSTALYISPQILGLLGYTQDEWLSDPHLWERLLHPDDRARVLEAIARRNETKVGTASDEYRLVARDGRIVWIRDDEVVVEGPGGRLAAHGYMQDITRQRHDRTRLGLIAKLLDTAGEELPPQELIHRTADDLAAAIGDVVVTYVELTADGRTRPLYTTSPRGLPAAMETIPEAIERLADGPLVIRDVLEVPWLAPARDVLARQQVRSAVDVPLLRNGVIAGALWFNTDVPRDWQDEEVALLAAVAEQLALVLERFEAREQRAKGERILDAVSRSAQHFLTGPSVDAALHELLAALGAATGASIAYVFENVPGAGPWPWCYRRSAWAPNAVPTLDDPRLGHTQPAPHWPRWAETLSAGDTITGDVASLPDGEREVFELFGSRSFVAVPVFAGGEWWGFIGFEDLEEARVWSAAEIDALKTASTLVAAAVERGRSEAILREQEQKLAAVFEAALDAIFITDDERRYVDVNPAACEYYGLSREELIGRRIDDFLPPHRLATVDEDWASYLAGGPIRAEWEIQAADGSARVAEASARPHFLPGLHIAFFRDMTERRRLEAELLNTQKLESLGRLAGGVAHDFNNLLTGITGYASLLLEREDADESLRHDAGEIKRTAERAAELTRQLLAFGRRQVLSPQPLDLNAVVSDVAPLLDRLAGEDVQLELRLAPGLGTVRADAGQLEQVLVNLVVNARDAMTAGGAVTIETRNAGDVVELVVSDTGCGMDAATAERIFEPFFTTRESGVGLGLASVYGIVTQSGGDVSVVTATDEGAEFTVRLPRIAEPAATQDAPAPATARSGSETILLVEDETVVRDLARRVLERRGYTVLACADGRAAIDTAAAHGPVDLLLTDVVMPGLRGWDVARLVGQAQPGVRVLYMSGYAEEALAERGDLQGFDLIEKPFAVDTLARRVRAALDAPAPAYAADSASAR